MSTSVSLKKATRIEGNANILIRIEHGRVETARFLVPDFRGFETFTRGRHVECIPSLVSRICGLCSSSHTIAGLRAIEEALSIPVPQSVQASREIILLSEWISSHALSYFFLTLPDAMGAQTGIFELMQSHPEIAKAACSLRNNGQKIGSLLAHRAAHPVSMAIGGFLVTPGKEDLRQVEDLARQIQTQTWNLLKQLQEEPIHGIKAPLTIPEDQRANFLTYRGDQAADAKELMVYDRSGRLELQFAPGDLEFEIEELSADWSFAKFPYLSRYGFPEGIVLVGPLARTFWEGGIFDHSGLQELNLVANLRQQDRKDLNGLDICRFLEIYWAAERIEHLARQIKPTIKGINPKLSGSGKGIGIVEAPRGLLIHNYLIHNGRLERMHLLVATQFNNALINLMLRDVAEKYVQGSGLAPEGESEISRCIRLFDPCISCATH